MQQFGEMLSFVLFIVLLYFISASPPDSERSYLRHWLDQTISEECVNE